MEVFPTVRSRETHLEGARKKDRCTIGTRSVINSTKGVLRGTD